MLEDQFNWIFVLIVGSLILVFFVFIAKSYLNNSNLKLARNMMLDIDSIMRGASAASKSAARIEIPKKEIIFTCYDECTQEGCSSDYSIGLLGISKDTPHEVIFAPNKIKSNFLITWTLDWAVPFRVTNFVYLTRPDIRYVLVYSDKMPVSKVFATQVYSVLSDNKFLRIELREEKELMDEDLMRDEGDYLVRLIFFYFPGEQQTSGTTYKLPINEDIMDARWDIVIFFQQDVKKGEVAFLAKPKKGQTIDLKSLPKRVYYGMQGIIGAIYSEDVDSYTCNMKKAFNKLNMVLDIYRERVIALDKESRAANSEISGCYYYYQNFLNLNFPETINYPESMTSEDFVMKSLTPVIEASNKQAILNSCPRIY